MNELILFGLAIVSCIYVSEVAFAIVEVSSPRFIRQCRDVVDLFAEKENP